MICYNCKEEIPKEIQNKIKFCCFCGACLSVTKKDRWDFSADKLNLEDYPDIPNIIKMEYERIFDLLDERQNYGAVLQLRDVYEVCLKIPVIVSMAYICSKEHMTEDEYKILAVVIEKELSCGTWHEIARRMTKILDQPELVSILKEADCLWSWEGRKKIHEFTGFSHWRNVTIGHGALAFDNQEEYADQFGQMLKKINEYIENTKESFSHIKYEHDNTAIIGGKKYDLFPFIVLDCDGLYFFDSYLYGKKKYDILDYHNAKKNSYRRDKKEVQYLEKLYNNVKDFLTALVSADKMNTDRNTIYSDWHTTLEEELLNKAILTKSYVRVNYLTQWVIKALENSKFALLSMESGLGKTSWCRTFDLRFCDNPEKISGYDIKVIYINRFYNKTTGSILTALQDVLSLSFDGRKDIKLDNPKYINRDADNKSEELSRVINFYYEKMHEIGNWREDKLLLIFDGLDEMIERSFFEWLPNGGQIGDNIKILFTVRATDSVQEIVSELERNLKTEFVHENSLTVRNGSLENINLLSDYIKSFCENNKIDVSENDISTLLSKSHNKFLYLPAVLLVASKDDSFASLDDNIYIELLEYLRKLYSDRYFLEIQIILEILAVTGAPVKIGELSQIMGYDAPNYLLASYLKDLAPFLAVEYKNAEAYYSLAHDEVIAAIKSTKWFDENAVFDLMKNCILDTTELLIRLEDGYDEGLGYEDIEGSVYIFVNMQNFMQAADCFDEDELIKVLHGWCDVCNVELRELLDCTFNGHDLYLIYNNIYTLCKSAFDAESNIVFEAYIRWRLLATRTSIYCRYTKKALERDEAILDRLNKYVKMYEDGTLKEDGKKYEQALMIYPALAGRVAIAGAFLYTTLCESKRKQYEEKLVDAFELARENAEKILEKSRYRDWYKSVINELGKNVIIADKEILNKRNIQINEKDILLDECEYGDLVYGELLRKSDLLEIRASKYLDEKTQMPKSLLDDADELYEHIMSEINKTTDGSRKRCLVRYCEPIVSVYSIALSEYGNTDVSGRLVDNMNRIFDIGKQCRYEVRNQESGVLCMQKHFMSTEYLNGFMEALLAFSKK